MRRGTTVARRIQCLLLTAVTLSLSVAVHAQWLYTRPGVGYGAKHVGLVVRDFDESLIVLARARQLPNIKDDYQRPDVAAFDPEDWLLAKFGSDKRLRWLRRVGGSDFPSLAQLATDRAGHIHAIGYFAGTARLGTGPATSTITSRGQRDICLARFAPDGSLISTRQWGGPDDETAYSITPVDNGALILAGGFKGTFAFSLPTGETRLRAAGSTEDGFVLYVDSEGLEQWVLHAAVEWRNEPGTTASLLPLSVGADRLGNCYITAGFEPRLRLQSAGEVLTFESQGQWDLFIARIDANGALQWARTAGGPGRDYGLRVLADHDGACFVTGRFGEGARFGEGIHAIKLQSRSSADLFMACYDSEGEFLGAVRTGGKGSGIDRDAWTIVMDELGNRYLIGSVGEPARRWSRPSQQATVSRHPTEPDSLNPPAKFQSIARGQDNIIRIVLEGQRDGIYVIETSTDLREWTPVSTQRIHKGLILIEDRIDAGPPMQFYRVRQPGTPKAVP